MKTCHILAGTALVAALAPAAQAQTQPGITSKPDPHHRQFLYFLPKAAVGATITQQITACPTGTGNIDVPVVTAIAIRSKASPDPKAAFLVDARPGFLSKRSTKLALRPDGTLSSFNVSSEGQGGEVLSTALKVGATALSWAFPPLVPVAVAATAAGPAMFLKHGKKEAPFVPKLVPKFQCRPAITKALGDLAKVRADIASIEARIVDGSPNVGDLDLLARRRAEEVKLVGSLSLSAGKGIRFDPARADFTDVPTPDGPKPAVLENVTAPPAYEKWLQVLKDQCYVDATAADVAKLVGNTPGAHGFRVTLTVDEAMFDLLAGSPVVAVPAGTRPPSTDRFVFYRRPVNVQMSVAPCGEAPRASGVQQRRSCAAYENAPENTEASEGFAIPQLSGLYSLSIGSGGLFGTREAKVDLNENGAPTALEYGSGSGGANIAKVLDSSLIGATTLRDARNTATQRRIDSIKAQNELDDLLSKDSNQ